MGPKSSPFALELVRYTDPKVIKLSEAQALKQGVINAIAIRRSTNPNWYKDYLWTN